MLIDSHCHLSFKDYPQEELEGILNRAADNEVAYMINIGAGDGVEGNQIALDLAKKYPQIFCTIGVHPHDAARLDAAGFDLLKQLSTHEKVVAIGEIGLDYHYNEVDTKAAQEKVFHQFIDHALALDKPIMIHDRDAGTRTYDILREHEAKKVMIHCFTGNQELATKYLDAGYWLSFTGIITFKKSHELREVLKNTPIERLLIETDAPYLAPEPYRGKRNEPSYVKMVAQKVAEVKGLSFDDVARITTLNAKRFFKLPMPDLTTQVAYAIRDSLYLNITNRCTLACTFCPKFVDYEVKGYYLKLKKEPTVEDVLTACGDVDPYKEIVFCGYGESTRRLDALLEIAKKLKDKYPGKKIRLNTDGLGNLIHERNILPELAQCIDSLSISLNAQDAATYVRYCPSKYGERAYVAVKEFIKEATKFIPEVVASVVGAPGVDRQKCQQIAEEELGAKFRFRDFNVVG